MAGEGLSKVGGGSLTALRDTTESLILLVLRGDVAGRRLCA